MSEADALNYSKQLADFDLNVRRFAARKLLELKHSVSIPYLIEALTDKDTLVRTNAENALIAIGPIDIDQIVKTTMHDDAEVRLRLLFVYKQYDTVEQLHELIPLISDPDLDVKNLAISIFNKKLSKQSSESIWKQVIDTNNHQELRDLYSDILFNNIIGIEEILLDDLTNTDLDEFAYRTACSLYILMNNDGDQFFLDKLDSKYYEERIAALYSNASLNQSQIIDITQNATEDSEGQVRRIAVELIGEYGNTDQLDFLNQLKNTPSAGVWKVSKEAISKINEKR